MTEGSVLGDGESSSVQSAVAKVGPVTSPREYSTTRGTQYTAAVFNPEKFESEFYQTVS